LLLSAARVKIIPRVVLDHAGVALGGTLARGLQVSYERGQ
jgi:hypothetical protein